MKKIEENYGEGIYNLIYDGLIAITIDKIGSSSYCCYVTASNIELGACIRLTLKECWQYAFGICRYYDKY